MELRDGVAEDDKENEANKKRNFSTCQWENKSNLSHNSRKSVLAMVWGCGVRSYMKWVHIGSVAPRRICLASAL